MAHLYSRGKRKIWWIQWRQDGKTHYMSLKTTDERRAIEYKKQLEASLTLNLLPKKTSTEIEPFLQDLCLHWKAKLRPNGYRFAVSHLRTAFGCRCSELFPTSEKWIALLTKKYESGMTAFQLRFRRSKRLEDITVQDCAKLLDHQVQAGLTRKTANHLRGVLSSLFTYARAHHGYICPDQRYKNPIEGVPRLDVPTPIIKWLTNADIEQQLNALVTSPKLRCIVALYIYAGLRCEEGSWLTMDDLDLREEGGHILIRAKTVEGAYWQPKTGKDRVVPISSKLRAELVRYLPAQSGKWLFPSMIGGRWTAQSIAQCLERANAAHNLTWTTGAFRHTFASHLAQRNCSLYKISTMMGNSPEVCRKHYAALITESFAADVELVHSDPNTSPTTLPLPEQGK